MVYEMVMRHGDLLIVLVVAVVVVVGYAGC